MDKDRTSTTTEPGSTVNVPSKQIVTSLPPLTEALPGTNNVQYAKVSSARTTTQVTTLPNGLRVASEQRFGQFCTVGVVIDSGPRYEVGYPSGVSHFLEKLAFHSTLNFPEKDKILRELERHGGICDCQSSRDTFIYAASADSRGLESVTRVLADVVMRPMLQDVEVDLAKQTILFELESLNMRPEQDTILMDMIHAAAYRENTLGLPKLCPADNSEKIDRNLMLRYLSKHHTPDRMVVAGVGVPHDELVRHVERFFVEQRPTWEEEAVDLSKSAPADKSRAVYTGGKRIENCEIPIYAAAGLPELAHVVIGLEGCSHQDPDFVAICVLNVMMGGGGSFSAGGPGKGMYARLYSNVLNRYHWMYSATAFNHSYNDSGLFCIHASAPPQNVKNMVEVVTRELVTMAQTPGEQELHRAKTQLQSMLLMNLEARPVVFEDIARQVLATGSRRPPEFFIDEIGEWFRDKERERLGVIITPSLSDKITGADIQRVARRLLATPPSLAARGEINEIQELADIQAGLLNSEGRIPGSGSKRMKFFR